MCWGWYLHISATGSIDPRINLLQHYLPAVCEVIGNFIISLMILFLENSFINLPSGLLMLFYAHPGIADVVGRRLGKEKLPYNPNKSYAGSIAMAVAGFLASIG
jgi:dolichol kinase